MSTKKDRARAKVKAYDAINRLRHRYRCADGNEAELREEIERLAAACDYGTAANEALFYGREPHGHYTADGSLPVWGFGCWLPGPDKGGVSPFKKETR